MREELSNTLNTLVRNMYVQIFFDIFIRDSLPLNTTSKNRLRWEDNIKMDLQEMG